MAIGNSGDAEAHRGRSTKTVDERPSADDAMVHRAHSLGRSTQRLPYLSDLTGIDDPACRRPLLLLSMPQMADPNFARTVVLLCDYTEEGAFGLVVNRQMTEPAWTLVKTEPPVRVDPELRLWVGGPVDPQRTWVLMARGAGARRRAAGDLPGRAALGVARADAAAAAGAAVEPRARHRRLRRLGPGQLDKEIAASAWLTMDVDPALIFGVPPDQMWETAIRRLGTDPSQLQTSSGVH